MTEYISSPQPKLDGSALRRLEHWLKRIGDRPERRALCSGLLEFLRRGLLAYEECRTTSEPRRAFSAHSNVLGSITDILEATEHDPVAWALLRAVSTVTVVFDITSMRGRLDIVFSGTEACFGLIHDNQERR